MEKQAFGVPKAVKKSFSYGLDPISIGFGVHGVTSGMENVPGVVGGITGGAAGNVATSKAVNAVKGSQWVANLARKLPGRYGKIVALGGTILGGAANLAGQMAGFGVGGKAGRSLGATPPGRMVLQGHGAGHGALQVPRMTHSSKI